MPETQSRADAEVIDMPGAKALLSAFPKVVVFDDTESCHRYAHGLGLTYLFPIDQGTVVPILIKDARRGYDPGELRWQALTPGTAIFHLLHGDGRVSLIDYDASCLRPLFRVAGLPAYGEFLAYIYASHVSPLRPCLERCIPAPFGKLATLHVPLPEPATEHQQQSSLRFTAVEAVTDLVERHGRVGVPWLSWVTGVAEDQMVCPARPGLSAGETNEPAGLDELRRDTLAKCNELIAIPPRLAEPLTQSVLIDPWGVRAITARPQAPRPTSTTDCLLEIRNPFSATFMALFLQSAEGRPVLDGLARLLNGGDTSLLQSKVHVPVPGPQKGYWISLAHDAEFLADMHERLAVRARNPFLRAVLPENCVVAVPPLHRDPLDPPQSWGCIRERMVREIVSLPLAGLS